MIYQGEDMRRRAIQFRFVNAEGEDVTGTPDVDGYSIRDYFDTNLARATLEEIRASYRGPDWNGIGVKWERDT